MIFPYKFVMRHGLIALSLVVCLSPLDSKAETPANWSQTDPSPTLQSLEKPKTTYQVGEIISYRIKVYWPSWIEGVRMSPPDLSLENLELIGVNQETESNSEESGGAVQILTFNFMAQAAGPAQIKHFSLKWTQGEGAATHELAIPSLKLNIVRSSKSRVIALLAVGGSAGLIGLPFLFWVRRIKNKKIEKSLKSKPMEILILEQLGVTQNQWQTDTNRSKFLNGLTHLLEQYAGQKLDWNPSRDDYNALQKKAEKSWNKKEALELIELFRTLEHNRFSGEQMESEQLKKIYQNVYTFIERRKIL